MPRKLSRKKTRSQKRGGAYGSSGSYTMGSPISNGKIQRGGRKSRSMKSKRSKSRSRKSMKRESFLSTLNQMGGFIRDGSTQFFKILGKK